MLADVAEWWMPFAQFTPFVSQVSPSFWTTLSQLKLNEYQLSDELIRVRADYTPQRTVVDRNTGAPIGAGCRIRLDGEGMDLHGPLHGTPMYGYVKNLNTLQQFKAADKHALFNRAVAAIWERIVHSDSDDVNEFVLLTYADLKSYKYYYWFAFPALLAKPGWMLRDGWQEADAALGASVIEALGKALSAQPHTIVALVDTERPAELVHMRHTKAFWSEVPLSRRLLLFVDPSQHAEAPGWPLRNILAMLHTRYGVDACRVLCWKDPVGETRPSRSMLADLFLEQSSPASRDECPDAVGWERDVHGRLVPKMVALGEMLDPHFLAHQAVDLNLRLMRWRMMPNLALEHIQHTNVLILGAGTLGCSVARTLLGWGVRRLTLMDHARVSFSNPVRQSLYEFTDCLEGGRPKAQAAADALQRIAPGVQVTGIDLSIPMPGHRIPPSLAERGRQSVDELDALIASHDAIFVLTDSRESRWVPTMLGAFHNKLVINAALGFDTYVVMRHGTRDERVGCYFCTDVVAPADSLTDRTLDQMCTVSRPGLAAIAGATAVEMLVSIRQGEATPHQVRGNLSSFTSTPMESHASEHCTACSPPILAAYERAGVDLVCTACDDPSALERIAGVDVLKAEVDARELDDIAWDSDS